MKNPLENVKVEMQPKGIADRIMKSVIWGNSESAEEHESTPSDGDRADEDEPTPEELQEKADVARELQAEYEAEGYLENLK